MTNSHSQEHLMDYDSALREASLLKDVRHLGKVTRVVGLIIEAHLPGMPVGGLCSIRISEEQSVEAEVVGLKGQHVMMMPIGDTAGIKVGCIVEPKDSDTSVLASDEMLGRILDGCGKPIDEGPQILTGERYRLYQPTVNPVSRKRIANILPLGVRVLDALITCGIGQRLSIMAGSGVGKSVMMGMIARHTKADVNVIALVGERGREVREFIEKDLGREGLKRSVVVVATSDAPPLIRMRAAFIATAIAEYFRDRGKKVLMLMDSLTRFAMAMREVGLATGEPPTAKGYTPSVFATLPKLLERVGTTDHEGSITGLYTIRTESDDINDPIADAVRSIVDGHIVLSRKLASVGHYPAVDIMHSLSRLHREIVDEVHLKAADRFRMLWSSYMEVEDFINMGIYAAGKNKTVDDAIARIDAMRNFLRQTMNEGTDIARTREMMMQVTGVLPRGDA